MIPAVRCVQAVPHADFRKRYSDLHEVPRLRCVGLHVASQVPPGKTYHVLKHTVGVL